MSLEIVEAGQHRNVVIAEEFARHADEVVAPGVDLALEICAPVWCLSNCDGSSQHFGSAFQEGSKHELLLGSTYGRLMC